MGTLEKLYEYCRTEGIIVENNTMHPKILGLYVKEDDTLPVISLNKLILNDRDETINILAEEIGHYATTVGNYSTRLLHYRDRISLNSCEVKALRWACDFLISDDEVIDCLSQGMSLHEIVDSLDVTNYLLTNKIRFMDLQSKFN